MKCIELDSHDQINQSKVITGSQVELGVCSQTSRMRDSHDRISGIR